MSTTLWGSIAANGSNISSSGGFSVANTDHGIYVITFSAAFRQPPAIVATQNNYGNTDQENTDGIVVPLISTTSATFVTGDANGNKSNRAFAFIVTGNT